MFLEHQEAPFHFHLMNTVQLSRAPLSRPYSLMHMRAHAEMLKDTWSSHITRSTTALVHTCTTTDCDSFLIYITAVKLSYFNALLFKMISVHFPDGQCFLRKIMLTAHRKKMSRQTDLG